MTFQFLVDLDDTIANTTRDLGGNPSRVPEITLVDGARGFLERYGRRCILLSIGISKYQFRKLGILGITGLFQDIYIVQTPIEKAHVIGSLARKNSVASTGTVMIGDRLDHDIAPAKLAGCITVRMRLSHASHTVAKPSYKEEVPDYTVQNFHEVLQLPFFNG